MRLLLDTHIALWAITDSPELSSQARDMILNTDNSIWVSTASIWEISIKYSLKKSGMPISGGQALDYFKRAGYQLLDIKASHTIATETLPWHHRDPFDRLLVAQAQNEPMQLLTSDALVAQYGSHIVRC